MELFVDINSIVHLEGGGKGGKGGREGEREGIYTSLNQNQI